MIENCHQLVLELKSKIAEKKAQGKTPRAVFDLDGTLIYYFPRTRQILVDAARMIPEIPEETIKNIESLELDDFPYWLNSLLDKISITDTEIREAFLRDWDDRFFTDQYLWADRAIKDSPAFLDRLTSAGVAISYLTGRHRNGMYLGTKGSIIKNGFPFQDGEFGILMKPLKEQSNALFKKAAAQRLAATDEVVLVFDNEPKEISLISSNIPDAVGVLYESPCSSSVALHDGIFKVRKFADLIEAWDACGD